MHQDDTSRDSSFVQVLYMDFDSCHLHARELSLTCIQIAERPGGRPPPLRPGGAVLPPTSDEAATTHAHAAGCPAVGATSWKLHGGHSHRLVYGNAILEEPRARTLAGTLSAARGSAVARTPWYSNWCVGLWHRDQRGYTQHLGRSSRRRKRRAVHNGCVRHRGWHRHALPWW